MREIIKTYQEINSENQQKLQEFYREKITEDGVVMEENLNQLFKLQDEEFALNVAFGVFSAFVLLLCYFGFRLFSKLFF